jgi:hypothetical protein
VAKQEEIKSVSGYPAKSFFVSMLTRDIELGDAILDLLDNCVDGAIRTRGKALAEADSLEGFWAHIKFSDKKFEIEDNCGGIPWDLAKNYAFRMGRPADEPKKVADKPGTIGLVGIGMKRAIFKMGLECYVHSNHKDDTFLVNITPDWFDTDKDWDFPAEREKPSTKELGTILEITELNDAAKLAFAAGSTFRENFATLVGESYSYLIEKGFKVKINNTEIRRRPVKICFEATDSPKKKSALIRPYIYQGRIKDVKFFVAVGYRSRLRTQEEQEQDSDTTFSAREAGWTVVCNDRVVLSNDRSVKTGWGFGGVPNFHNQFSCIAGIVEFESANTGSLPVTTTKRGIDTGKEIYTIVRQRMQEGLKLFTRNTNKWKTFESELKTRFDRLHYLDLRGLKTIAGKLPLTNIRGDGVQRQYKPALPVKEQDESTHRISFVREIEEIDEVSQFLFEDARSADEVGEACFEKVLEEARK